MAASPYTLTPIEAQRSSGSARVVLSTHGKWQVIVALTLDEARELAAALLAAAAKAEALPPEEVK